MCTALLPLLVAAALGARMLARSLGSMGLGAVGAFAVATATVFLFAEAGSAFGFLSPTGALAASVLAMLLLLPTARGIQAGIKIPRVPPELAYLLPVLLVLGAVALAAPPNTWDSMSYHLTRVFFWQQNGSIAHFPTADTRQLFFTPLAEYWILFLRLLCAGSDRFANLPQFTGLLVLLLALRALWKKLGHSSPAFLLALSLSFPLVLHEVTSTQNDLLVAALLFSALALLLEPGRLRLALGALAFAEAVAVKPTGVFFVAAIAPLLFWEGKLWPRRRLVQAGALAGILAAVLLSPTFARNTKTFGGIISDPAYLAEYRLTGGPGAAVSVFAANLAAQFALPFEAWNGALDAAMAPLSGAEREAFHDPFHAIFIPTHEDYAGGGWLFWLLLIFSPVAAWNRSFRLFAGCAIACVFALSVSVRWQAWNLRLLLSAYCFTALAIAIAVDSLAPAARRLVRATILALVIPLGGYALLAGGNRPLFGIFSVFTAPRGVLYFTGRPGLLRESLGATAAMISGHCRQYEVWNESDSYEYPLYQLVNEAEPTVFRPGGKACGRLEFGEKHGTEGRLLFSGAAIRVREF